MAIKTFLVPGMHCGHCTVARELEGVDGVQGVDVDLETKLVTIPGGDLEDAVLMAAIHEAGYDGEAVASR